jgi:hypothetical protein
MERFWSKVEKTDGCWLWRACLMPSGYGMFRHAGKAVTAHRVSWLLAYGGELGRGIVIQQSCGNRLCVRPDHLKSSSLRSSSRNPPRGDSLRFWAHVDKTGECWVWTGARNAAGYGDFHRGGGMNHVFAHRYSWELVHGSLPEGRLVLHHCDNPPCVNPKHLFDGTHADNTRDMIRKGRDRFWWSASTPRCGECGARFPREFCVDPRDPLQHQRDCSMPEDCQEARVGGRDQT